MGVKVTVVGGGSTYTPELIVGLASRQARLPVDELVLLDVEPERLRIVAGLARRILERRGWGGRLVETLDRSAALDGADFVVVQLRVGGQAARFLDETIPLRFGCIGQETTGPGGFAKALRTVPVVLELAAEVGRRSVPGAWIVDFTNPVGIVTQALLDAGHRAIGLCNVAIGFQRRFAARFGVEPGRVELEHVGLNHLTWERAVRVDGVDRLPELLATDGEEIARDVGQPVEVLRTLGAIPSYYLEYYYRRRQVLEAQLAGDTRAEEVMAIERELLDLYRDHELAEAPPLLARRGGAFYSEAAAQLIASLHDDAGDVQVVDVRNGTALAGLSPDAVVEVPALIDREGAHPVELAPLPPEMLGLVQAVKAYERLAVRAAVTADRAIALEALVANPLVADYDVARPLLAALLAEGAAHLPAAWHEGPAGA